MKSTTFAVALVASLVLLTTAAIASAADQIPPAADGAKQRLNDSPRHGEFTDIEVPGRDAKLKAYVVYPETKEKAPVVIVIHEIFGLSDWVRAVADQLAADGFIAVAPDMLSGKGPGGGGTEAFTGGADDVRTAVRDLKPDEVKTLLDATRNYGLKLPAASGKSATIGFCWGGAASFRYATQQPDLNAAVVYYGVSPEEGYENIKCPVLGVYGQNDERVNATIDPAREKMKAAGQTYETRIYDGAGHGFLRQQAGPDNQPGANGKAAAQAWPETIKFLREHTK